MPVEVPAGSVVFFNGFTLHRSLDNRRAHGYRARAGLHHCMSAHAKLPGRSATRGCTNYRDIVMVCGPTPSSRRVWERGSARPYLRPESVCDHDFSRPPQRRQPGATPPASRYQSGHIAGTAAGVGRPSHQLARNWNSSRPMVTPPCSTGTSSTRSSARACVPPAWRASPRHRRWGEVARAHRDAGVEATPCCIWAPALKAKLKRTSWSPRCWRRLPATGTRHQNASRHAHPGHLAHAATCRSISGHALQRRSRPGCGA